MGGWFMSRRAQARMEVRQADPEVALRVWTFEDRALGGDFASSVSGRPRDEKASKLPQAPSAWNHEENSFVPAGRLKPFINKG